MHIDAATGDAIQPPAQRIAPKPIGRKAGTGAKAWTQRIDGYTDALHVSNEAVNQTSVAIRGAELLLVHAHPRIRATEADRARRGKRLGESGPLPCDPPRWRGQCPEPQDSGCM